MTTRYTIRNQGNRTIRVIRQSLVPGDGWKNYDQKGTEPTINPDDSMEFTIWQGMRDVIEEIN